MSEEQLVRVIDAYFAAIRSRSDVGRFLAADATLFVPATGWRLEGRSAIQEWAHRHYEREFDAHPEGLHLVVGTDGAGAEFVFTGTHVGDYAGIAATGREVQIPMAMFFDATGDTVTSIRLHYPADLLRAQLLE